MVEFLDLIRDLSAEEEKTRAFAAEDIAYDGLIEGIGPLVERLQVEPSRFVREVIVNSLKTMHGIELVEKVIPLLRSDDAFIRNASIDILSVEGETASESIRKLLADTDKDVRKFAIDVLFLLNSPYSAEMIAEILDDPDVNNVITAVEYLTHLDASDSVHQINEIFMNTPNLLLRCTCLEGLALIGDEESTACVARMYPDYQLISPLEQYSYLKFIAARGTDVHLPLITSLMKDKGEIMHKEIINAIEGILRRSHQDRLSDDLLAALLTYLDTNINDINKYELLVLLGEFQNDEIFSFLVQHANSTIKLVCLGAIEALGNYGHKEAQPVLVQLRNHFKDADVLEAIDRSLALLDR